MARKGLSTDTIILAATELIQKKGYDNFSLRELAGVLDVKPASLYNHWKITEIQKSASFPCRAIR